MASSLEEYLADASYIGASLIAYNTYQKVYTAKLMDGYQNAPRGSYNIIPVFWQAKQNIAGPVFLLRAFFNKQILISHEMVQFEYIVYVLWAFYFHKNSAIDITQSRGLYFIIFSSIYKDFISVEGSFDFIFWLLTHKILPVTVKIL